MTTQSPLPALALYCAVCDDALKVYDLRDALMLKVDSRTSTAINISRVDAARLNDLLTDWLSEAADR